ncbi:MAG: pseudouridine synthase [Planctomycetota bacterium]
MPHPGRPAHRSHQVTLERALSKLGVLSRTQARVAILAGRVAVDGVVTREPERWVVPERGLSLDGKPVSRQLAATFAMHKPTGFVTTRADELRRRTIYDLLPAGMPWLFPIGRLDRDSSGLLLLTNDTRLGEAISGSASTVRKVYEVTLETPVDDDALEPFRAGFELTDGTRLEPVGVRITDPLGRELVFELREGKNRQIRRMVEAIDNRVVRLHRTAIGPVQLGTLAPGALRPLTANEVAALAQHVRRPDAADPQRGTPVRERRRRTDTGRSSTGEPRRRPRR